MRVPFIKAHGAGNDFLFTLEEELAAALAEEQRCRLARAICHRQTGIGADGWYWMGPATGECDAVLHLYNSDGSGAELSGNGTRCAAAILAERGGAAELRLATGAGVRLLRLTGRQQNRFWFEMEMGEPVWREEDLRSRLELPGGAREVTILDVGNPQCAVAVDSLEFDWRSLGAEIEAHPRFPRRTNVSFLRRLDPHAIEARFFERGAGATLSSGTGASGAAAAAILLGLAASPVQVVTEAGPLEVVWDAGLRLKGPAELTGRGEFYWNETLGGT